MFPKDDEYYSCESLEITKSCNVTLLTYLSRVSTQRASMTYRVVLAMIDQIAKNEEKMK